jgi:hypothetical protein
VQSRFDGADRDAELAGDFGLGQPIQVEAQHGGTLSARQPGNGAPHLRALLGRLHDHFRARRGIDRLGDRVSTHDRVP